MSDHARPGTTFPAAELDRRFYAFTLDRLLTWTVYAAVGTAAYLWLHERGRTGLAVGLVLGTVLLLALLSAALLGLRGTSPGKAALGLRVVTDGAGEPIGVGAALLRLLVLGVSTLPTFGLGVATLAWTAVVDGTGKRRGWHDHLARSVVVDVRPVPVAAEEAAPRPQAIVNLTAMRLVPPPAAPSRPAAPASRATAPAPVAAPVAAQRPAPAAPPAPAPVAPPSPPPAAPPAPPVRQPTRQPAPAAVGGATPVRPPQDRLGPPPPAAPTHRAAAPAPPPTAPPVAAPPAAPAPTARWRVSFDTGESFVVEGLTLVGRRPEGRPGEAVRRLVALRSSDMSVSKTHAQFQVVPDGALVVMDRGSTNGSVLLRRGVSRDLSAGKPATLLHEDVVRFGDRTMTVVREV